MEFDRGQWINKYFLTNKILRWECKCWTLVCWKEELSNFNDALRIFKVTFNLIPKSEMGPNKSLFRSWLLFKSFSLLIPSDIQF